MRFKSSALRMLSHNVMDAVVLERLEGMIKNDPDNEELKRCYALAHSAINWKKLTPEKQEAVLAELEEIDNEP